MAYFKHLSIYELQCLAPRLKKNYLAAKIKKGNKKPAQKRLDFLNLYLNLAAESVKHPDQKRMQLVLTGALVYALEEIKVKDYKGCSPEQKTSWYGFLTGKGSALYSTLKSELRITKQNKLSNDERLHCLVKLYNYIKEYYPYQRDLLDSIHFHLANIKKRELDRIHGTAEGIPPLRELEEGLTQLPDEYKAHAPLRNRDPEREIQLEFIELINKTCNDYYSKNIKEFSHNFAYMQSCNVQYGAALFVLMRINSKHNVVSPEGSWGGWLNKGSDLYKLLLKVLREKHLNKIDSERRIACLRALAEHIECMKKSGDLPEKFLKYEKLIKDYISQEEVQKHTPKWYVNICHYLMRYGLGFAATKLTADVVLKWIGGAIASTVSGPVGLVVYMTGGTILVSQLGKLVTEKAIPKATASLYEWSLDRIGKSITKATVGNVIYRFPVGRKGDLRAMLNDPNVTDEDREAIQNWIETLLEMPDDIILPAEKQHIRYVWDELDEKLQNVPERNEERNMAYTS